MDLKTAKVVAKSGFLECIIAPGFDKEALELFKDKKNLRLLESYDLEPINEPDFKRVSGGLLLQELHHGFVDIQCRFHPYNHTLYMAICQEPFLISRLLFLF
jgi:AICAR transformylase/IMP cyclohydrolase PurH